MGTDISLKKISAGGIKPLSPTNLAVDFGPRSAVSKRCVAKLYDILRAGHPDLTSWKQRFGRILGGNWQRPAKALRACSHKLRIDCAEFMPDAFLFALQTYYALLLDVLVRRFPALDTINFSEEPFSWHLREDNAGFAAELKCLSTIMGEYFISPTNDDCNFSGDLLKALYQELFPRPLRHRLGEYYTPDWLARHMLDQVGFSGQPNLYVLDPACGSGTFLMSAIQRIRKTWMESYHSSKDSPDFRVGDCHNFRVNENGTVPFESTGSSNSDSSKEKLCQYIFSHVVGIDLNPLAVMTARANYLIAVHDLLPMQGQWEVPIYLGDSILGDLPHNALNMDRFDVVVGNPPWIAWDNLPGDYREATKPLWEDYGLFSLSGKDARHGGGKKDLSMLMLYAVADRHLKTGGRLGFVITQTIFQTNGAGDGFRRFRLGRAGEYLKVERVDDFVATRPFGDAANWTSTIVIEKGRPTHYPVPYVKWSATKEKRLPTPFLAPFLARPIEAERPTSPWLIQPEDFHIPLEELIGPSDYLAHLGANTGGANGVYWLELLGAADGGVRVRNYAEKSKTALEVVEAVIEPDLLYPLLCWGDIGRYSAQPSRYILLAQDCQKRTGIEQYVMREKYPRTFEYLSRFEQRLKDRAAYRRYQSAGPFYSMYNVGPYTTAPIKVVWRRMDSRINAAVVTTVEDRVLGTRPIIPQETCAMIACQSLDEAHYLCAMLNSSSVNGIVQSHSVNGGKSFGTPNMLKYLNLRSFDPVNALHKELAKCSEEAHQNPAPDSESRVDRLVFELYGLGSDEAARLVF
jgi:hypothetical protein